MQSFPVPTLAFTVEVKTTRHLVLRNPSAETLDRIATFTPIVWFSSLAIAFLAILLGAAAHLRLPAAIE